MPPAAGALAAAEFFDGSRTDERLVRRLVSALYARIDWTWMTAGGEGLRMAWTPETGFHQDSWRGYNEGLILYLLALGAPDHALPSSAYRFWTSSYVWKSLYGFYHVVSGPLFTHQVSHLWIDFRGIQDDVMRLLGIDYFENSRRATYAQQAYADANPGGFEGYGKWCWGITASDGPGEIVRTVKRRRRAFHGYRARGILGNDDGTLSPWAAIASMPFAPEIVMPTIRWIDENHRDVRTKYGFMSSFNPTFPTKPGGGWLGRDHYGMNQGPILIMIANFRTGSIWRLMRRCAPVVLGLRRAGFGGGWLGSQSMPASDRLRGSG